MTDYRSEVRVTDAELAMISYQSDGKILQQLGNVENISLNGAGMIVDHAIPVGTAVTMTYGYGELAAIVRHCAALAEGHAVGIEFVGSSRASTLHFQPELLVCEVQ